MIEQAATEWHDDGRPPARLWERGQLAAAVTDTGAHLKAGELVTDRVELNPTARDFLRTSIRRDRSGGDAPSPSRQCCSCSLW